MAKPKTSGHGYSITALNRNIAWATSLINNQVFAKETPYADDVLVLLQLNSSVRGRQAKNHNAAVESATVKYRELISDTYGVHKSDQGITPVTVQILSLIHI